jgi:hypothetical protein
MLQRRDLIEPIWAASDQPDHWQPRRDWLRQTRSGAG